MMRIGWLSLFISFFICIEGVPLIVVLSTALTDIDYYHDASSEGCRLAPRYPPIYYATMVGKLES